MLDDRDFLLQWRTVVAIAVVALAVWLVFDGGAVSVVAAAVLVVATFARNALRAAWQRSRAD